MPNLDTAPPAYRKRPGILETELDREIVLVDPETQAMFSLNPVARLIWSKVDAQSLESIAAEVTEKFAVELSTARRDAQELTEQLVEAGLIHPVQTAE